MGIRAVRRRLESGEVAAVRDLAARSGTAADHASIDDPAWEQNARGDDGGFLAVLTHENDRLVGYAQSIDHPTDERAAAAVMIEPTITEQTRTAAIATETLRELVTATGNADAPRPIHLWVTDATDSLILGATSAGFIADRTLLRMTCELPVPVTTTIDTRPFVAPDDDAAFLGVNARAFADHPDQGDMDQALLEARRDENWYDPAGFLLHERDGRLAGFCWTKTFAHLSPSLGEIFIIGVDPDFQGLKLGLALVEAGLDHLHRVGMEQGFLFVEAENEPAVRLYERLGFSTTRTDRSFVVAPSRSTS